MQTITIGGNSYNLCTMPAKPGAVDIEVAMNDAVAVFTNPFTRQEQTQVWPGGDFWDGSMTLPPMTRATSAAWEGFLSELRGRFNVFQVGDARATGPLGTGLGSPAPLVDSSNPAYNLPMTWSLVTKGWRPSQYRLLLPGDYFQIGYRLHKVCEQVNSDATGAATIPIWPSIRETLADGTPLILTSPKGLFRLAANRRTLQASKTRLAGISLKFVEAK
jgi:hypothetical protein